jgi:hypothetical protein
MWRDWAGAADVLSKEVRVTRFKQLLLEGGVNAFSLYAKVKAKLDKDERCGHMSMAALSCSVVILRLCISALHCDCLSCCLGAVVFNV